MANAFDVLQLAPMVNIGTGANGNIEAHGPGYPRVNVNVEGGVEVEVEVNVDVR